MKKILTLILLICTLTACNSKQEPIETIGNYSEIADENFSKISNQSIGWGLKKNKGAPPDILKKDIELLSKYNAFYMDQSGEKTLYLTFDEGYENGYTEKILDVLKKCEVPATFFVTGPYIKNESELITRMLSEGHIVGNHTKNHPNLPKLASAEAMAGDILALSEEFLAMYGEEMEYLRPPEGVYSERLLALSNALGYKTIFWSFAYKDWDTKTQKGGEYAKNQVIPYLHDGAIILLHAVSSDNAEALEDIINYAKSEGYTFKSLSELK